MLQAIPSLSITGMYTCKHGHVFIHAQKQIAHAFMLCLSAKVLFMVNFVISFPLWSKADLML